MKFNDIVSLITKKFIASIISLKLLIIIIIFISIIVVLEVVSSIPIVGDKMTDSVKEQIQNLSSMNVLNENKIPYYLEIEKESYVKEIRTTKTIEKSTFSLASIGEAKAYDDLNNSSSRKENITMDITSITRQYRLWWQSLAAFDMISLGGNEETFIVVDQVSVNLNPIYNFNFSMDKYYNANTFTLNDHNYTKVVTTKKYYEDGKLDSTTVTQINTKEIIPYPRLNSVSTMFFDYSFSYNREEISNSSDTSTSSTTGIKYISDDTGNYIFDYLSGKYKIAKNDDSGKRYSKVNVKTITSISTESRYFSFVSSEIATKNTRYMDYFDSFSKENGNNYKKKNLWK